MFMEKDVIKSTLTKLVNEADVIAPSIVNFDKDRKYGRVTDEDFDYDSFSSWEIEAKAIIQQLSDRFPSVYQVSHDNYLNLDKESKRFHSRSIFVHKMKLILGGMLALIESPLIDSSDSDKKFETNSKIDKKNEIVIQNKPLPSSETWKLIENDYDISKRSFGKKINFVTDQFKRKVIFRDIEHAYILAYQGYSKPSVILAGSVIEELLRLYLKQKKVPPKGRTFNSYIKACEENGLLKTGISRLSDSVRHFRNSVHLQKENNPQSTITKVTAKGAVASIFTIANDL